MTDHDDLDELDVEQVFELMDNGFTREGASFAVAESHHPDDELAQLRHSAALLNLSVVQEYPESDSYA